MKKIIIYRLHLDKIIEIQGIFYFFLLFNQRKYYRAIEFRDLLHCVYVHRYEACWYNGSSRTQSLYVLVLRKCLSPPKLTGGGLVALNLDSFLQVS